MDLLFFIFFMSLFGKLLYLGFKCLINKKLKTSKRLVGGLTVIVTFFPTFVPLMEILGRLQDFLQMLRH